jgi:hypothetical protein
LEKEKDQEKNRERVNNDARATDFIRFSSTTFHEPELVSGKKSSLGSGRIYVGTKKERNRREIRRKTRKTIESNHRLLPR